MARMTIIGMAICVVFGGTSWAEEWPGWRGPRLDGSSREKNLPLQWTTTENIAWKSAVPGVGHSSPVVVGDHVFLTSCLVPRQERILLAFGRRTGRELWRRVVVTSPLEPKHQLNSYASSTPASDGEHVYVTFLRIRPKKSDDPYPINPREKSPLAEDVVPEMVLSSYTMTGTLTWQKTVGQFYSRQGFCSSPILYKDLIIVNGDQDAEAYIAALDRHSGALKWKADRPHRTRSYCVPLIVTAAGKTQLVLTGSETVTSYDPDNGNLLWFINGPTEQFVASPVFTDDVLFLTAGFPTYHNMGIRPDGAGNVTRTHVLWHEKDTTARKAAYVPSPIASQKWFYMISDQGFLSCFEAKSGKRLWMEKLGEHHSASPVVADGYIYMTDDDGITYVLKVGAEFNLVSRNPLEEKCFSSLAISGGQIFVRTTGHLWCVGAAARTNK
jgi:outer membrane protein assembly factor BamB